MITADQLLSMATRAKRIARETDRFEHWERVVNFFDAHFRRMRVRGIYG